jgi:hypothetical protein
MSDFAGLSVPVLKNLLFKLHYTAGVRKLQARGRNFVGTAGKASALRGIFGQMYQKPAPPFSGPLFQMHFFSL